MKKNTVFKMACAAMLSLAMVGSMSPALAVAKTGGSGNSVGKDISNTDDYYVDHDTTWLDYNLSSPKIWVSYEDENGYDVGLKQGKDYVFTGWYDYEGNKLAGNPTKAGDYKAEIKGIGSYTGTYREGIEILDPKDISNYSATRIDSYGNDVDETLWIGRNSLTNLKEKLYRYAENGSRIYLSASNYTFAGWCDDDYDPISTPTTGGDYIAKFKGAGSMDSSTTRYVWYEIRDKADFDSYTLENDTLHQGVNNLKAPKLFYYYRNDAGNKVYLTPGVDYKVTAWYKYNNEAGSYDKVSAPTAIGNYRAVVKGAGSLATYEGEAQTEREYIYVANSKDISTYYYDGSSRATLNFRNPNVELYCINDKNKHVKLKAGKNYTFVGWRYSGSLISGIPTTANESYSICYVGAGGYKGALSVYTYISKEQLYYNNSMQIITAKNITKKIKAKSAKTIALGVKVKGNAKKVYKITKAKKCKKFVKINKKGKLVVKKGLKKGTYKVTIKVTAKATKVYRSATKTFTVTLKAK